MTENAINFLSVDGKIARSSYDEYFSIGETVMNNDRNETSKIVKFEIDYENNEILVFLENGLTQHLDFLNKISKYIYIIELSEEDKLYFDNFDKAKYSQKTTPNCPILTYELK